jgi:ABC-type dipeptide/oligopeptide/nickel transport system permease component
VAGSALVETVFGWPGVGRLMYDSIFTRDYPVLLGILLLVSVSVILVNLLTDVAYALFDPRVRY